MAEVAEVLAPEVIIPDQVIPKNYPKKFRQCRSLDHEWSHVPGLCDHPNFRYIKGAVSECLTCTLVRTRWLLSNGRRFGTKYEYPDGYQLSKKDPRQLRLPAKREWRESYVRTLGFREEQPAMRDEIKERRASK